MFTTDQTAVLAALQKELQLRFGDEASGHDYWHLSRVAQNALHIAHATVAPKDIFLVALGAWLHDIVDWKFVDGDEEKGPAAAAELLKSLGVAESYIQAVQQIIREISYKGAQVSTPMATLEGEIVQDADRLDAIGAVGIARAFAYGGHKNRLMYDPNISPEFHDSFAQYKKSQAPTLNHFYEKLLLLKDRMNTDAGKEIATQRHVFMENYLEQFLAEWDGKR